MQAKIGVLAIVAVVVIAGGVFFMRSDDGAKNAVTDITMPRSGAGSFGCGSTS